MHKKLVILGSGAYANTVQDVADQLGYVVVAMLDDKIDGQNLSEYIRYIDKDVCFIPAFGNNEFRLLWVEKLLDAGARLATLIHPTAYVSPRAIIKDGCVVLPKSIVNTDVIVERGCIINIGAIVDHGTVLEQGVHLAPGAIVKGENRVPRTTKVDSGTVVEARRWPV